MEIALHVQIVVQRILSNISGCTGTIFAFFHHMKAIYVPMISVPYFLICQGTLHDNQIMLP